MTSKKILESFKKFPQQIPIFKKGEKVRDTLYMDHNSIFGNLEGVTSYDVDSDLNIYAIGTKKGDIKICGFPSFVNTLVTSSIKPILALKFLKGQGRLLSVNSDNEIILWQYNNLESTWIITDTKCFSIDGTLGNICKIAVNERFQWKSPTDDVAQLLLVAYTSGIIKEAIIVGGVIHVYNEDKSKIDREFIYEKCSLETTFEVGEIKDLQFNGTNKFFISYSNGFVVVFEANVNKPNDEVIEPNGKINEPEKNDETPVEPSKNGSDNDKKDETNEKVDEKSNTNVKNTAKEESKNKESIQFPYADIKLPEMVSKLTLEKLLSVCWMDEKIALIGSDDGHIKIYSLSENAEMTNTETINISDGPIENVVNLQYFNLNQENYFTFVVEESSSQKVVLVKNQSIDKNITINSSFIHSDIIFEKDADNEISSSYLLLLCEAEILLLNLSDLSEIKHPLFQMQNYGEITEISSIVKVTSSLFENMCKMKTLCQEISIRTQRTELINEDVSEFIDVFSTAYSDGTIVLWKIVDSGIVYELFKFQSKDLYENESFDSEKQLLKLTFLDLFVEDDLKLTLIAGNNYGTIMLFKFDTVNTLSEITCPINGLSDKDGIHWTDLDSPKFLTVSAIQSKCAELSNIVQLEPSLPVTSVVYQPLWDLLAIGCTYGFVVVDVQVNSLIHTYCTLQRSLKTNDENAPPLSMGQQLRKSMRQSFRKLKKLKPAPKHTYTVNDEKKDKDQPKTEDIQNENQTKSPEENGDKPHDVSDKIEEKGEASNVKVESSAEEVKTEEPKSEEVQSENKKEEIGDSVVESNKDVIDESNEAELIVEISRIDKPSSTVRSLLFVTTSLKSITKEPSLFVGTNSGAVYAFEMSFSADEAVEIKLSKELHLQHKAPVISLEILDSSSSPLLKSKQKIGDFVRKFIPVECEKEEIEKSEEENKPTEPVGPAGDSDKTDVDAKAKSGTLPSSKSSEKIEEIESRKSVDATNDKSILSSSLKKSGTLPASFLQAIGKTTADYHELLVVSEEQVKVFSLPSLKARHKYKVLDTGHHFSHLRSTTTESSEKKPDNSTSVSVDSNKKLPRRVLSFGFCKKKNTPKIDKWFASVALSNGEVISLFLNNLKKMSSSFFNTHDSLMAHVTSGSLNLVISTSTNSNIQVTDLSNADYNMYELPVGLNIPSWSRPVELTIEAQAAEVEAKVVTNGDHANGDESEKQIIDEEKDNLGDETVIQQQSSVHQGDVTMDSIKEYMTNMDGNITVKTYESSTEKHITVNDGKIETTIHEKQIDDGHVVKDDVVKITSDTVSSKDATPVA